MVRHCLQTCSGFSLETCRPGSARQCHLRAAERSRAAQHCQAERRYRVSSIAQSGNRRARISWLDSGCPARGGSARAEGRKEPMTKRLAGKSILITGASSGIGRAIARRFAAEGARLVLADITHEVREGGVPTTELLRAEGHDVEFIRIDVATEEDAARSVDVAVGRFGRLDVLVNDAAIGVGKRLTDTSLEEWNRALAVNLTGVFLMSRAAVVQMLKQDIRNEARGRIVNISSQHGMIACPEDIAYGTSKSGVVYMTRQIAADYAKDFIICNAVAPGKILTGKTGRATEPRWMDYSLERTPMPRLGTPDDVANAALFLASDEATFITGENILVDGGWMAA